MLFHNQIFGNGELRTEDKIGEGIFMEDTVAIYVVVFYFEIAAEVPSPQTIENRAIARELAQRLTRMGQLFTGHVADLLNEVKLVTHLEFIQFIHTLVTESHLKHSFLLKPSV